MSDKWMWVTDTIRVKRTNDGQWHGQRFDDGRASMSARREMRKDTAKNPRLLEAPGSHANFRVMGTLPITADMEMHQECGLDPEKQQAWLRDHPEFLTAAPREFGLKSKRTVFFPGGPRK